MKVNKYILTIIILSIALIGSVYLVVRTTSIYNRAASVNESSVTLENSYLFASPLQAKADSKEQVRITVYLLDGRGLGVPNQKVSLKIPSTISTNSIQPITDESGKATFDLSSSTAQSVTVTAITGNSELPQRVKINFY